jgi:hypothetical protein
MGKLHFNGEFMFAALWIGVQERRQGSLGELQVLSGLERKRGRKVGPPLDNIINSILNQDLENGWNRYGIMQPYVSANI